MSVEKIKTTTNRPSRKQAEEAVRTLLSYIGEDYTRGGLIDTPARYIRAFDEHFNGYNMNASDELTKTFDDIEGYDDMVLVKDIDFVSHCEHHIAPIIGKAHIAYWPNKKIVGISKLARIVDIYAHRLTSQENMTRQLADVIEKSLQPKGCAVMIVANHQCMSSRGVNKTDSVTVTSHFTGVFKDTADIKARFMEMVR